MGQAEFDQAVQDVKGLPDQPPDVLLRLYGLFKQATMGDASGKRPGVLDFKGRAKFDAWAERRGMSRESAMEAYATVVRELLKAHQK
ncbi:MAG TPA: acyl-CoA-binding protein [Myxococcota bacterium]|nr:acyl-CoA-binding protein [Myxococcota bacterium]HRY96107.1 acyl-CoA-binding protein [Myxococcota bacterium]HSA23430.1 acyl-CoA-binding protein [Myxococcota bacterium]